MKTSVIATLLAVGLAVAAPAAAVPVGPDGDALQARAGWTSYWTTRWTVTRSSTSRTVIAAAPSTTSKAVTTTTAKVATSAQSPAVTPAAPASTPVQAAAVSDLQTAAVNAHNELRAAHNAGTLTWNATLADAAKRWTEKCHWGHSQGVLLPFTYGENLAAGYGGSTSVASLIQLWSDEVSEMDPNNPQYSHYTQMVWKSTKEIGCAITACTNFDAFGTGPTGVSQYLSCAYYPAGNYIGQFKANVDGVTCAKC